MTSLTFLFGWSGQVCDDDHDFYLLHGALLLFAWMVVAPLGIFYARQDAVLSLLDT